MSQLIYFRMWSKDTTAYNRNMSLLKVTTESVVIQAVKGNLGNGALTGFNGANYWLLVDGAPRCKGVITGNLLEFTLNTSQMVPGWHLLDISGATGGEAAFPYAMYLKRGAVTTPDLIPIFRGSFSFEQVNNNALPGGYEDPYSWGWIPGAYNPRQLPASTTRVIEDFATALGRQQLHTFQIVPNRRGDAYRVTQDSDGVRGAMDYQAYFWPNQYIKQHPRVPLQDGPRGVAALPFVSHIECGITDTPSTGRIHNLYALTPWSLVKVRRDGSVVTLAGWRHPSGQPPKYYHPDVQTSSEGLELVGDWSSVPVERRGFWEAWGFTWDDRTIINNTDTNAAPIPSERNLQPHINPVIAFVADTQHNRIVKVTWPDSASSTPNPPPSHAAPPVCTEFITGLQDPWDVIYYEGKLFVSERKAHRISVWDATTGAYLSTLLQGPDWATVGADRFVYRKHPSLPAETTQTDQTLRNQHIALLRTASIVAPEGMYHIRDGQDSWLYYGSIAQKDVRRVNMDTGVWEIVVPDFLAEFATSFYCKFGVSDGTFGPRGTVALATWSNTAGGNPYVYLPAGFTDPDNGTRHWDQFNWDVSNGTPGQGPKGQYVTGIYCLAVGMGIGKMVVGFSNEGLAVWTKAQAGDPVESAATRAGAIKWRKLGYEQVYGPNGFSLHQSPLPWGVDSDIDAFLTFHGHTP